MAGLTAHGATFSFGGFTGAVTGISIESQVAELADMTGISDAASTIALRPTGAWSGGGVTVDFLATQGILPTLLVRTRGQLVFASPNFSYAVNAVLESASMSAQAGDLIKGTLKFRPTDYYG